MKTTLLHPAYFGPIAHYAAIVQSNKVVFENEDNYQKQTYRNRAYIYGANGKLLLTIPIKHNQKEKRQLYRDIRIENDFKWQIQHWKSLESAYRTSPFFEYYEDELVHLFEKPKEFLMDFNHQCREVIIDCLQLDVSFSKTSTYVKDPIEVTDLRNLINARKEKQHNLQSYIQVFEDKQGFIPNLSILDLIFNEGTNALTYLENQSVFL
ncbi:WbqC-like protein [Aquimarina sp. MAR_2010_214]|uniref:WbqC family protein n=1 Tax=Aquimarina sp. MAR_2010_214 TaxID=1250026 RepID=UPI000C711430|nr:WbqC family protein [Aquimarina sp. MAR_2010_214]PKV50120.1 WbqC-like protein [Aquimarina sp. MAR_2010_214]